MRIERDQLRLRLWEHMLLQVYGTTDVERLRHIPKNDPYGHAFFLCMDMAFCHTPRCLMTHKMGSGCVPVHHLLVQYMAGWGREMSRGYEQTGGPTGEKPNHFVRRAFEGFLETLRSAIKLHYLEYREDGMRFGAFKVPQWLIDHYMHEVYDEAEYLNREWDANPRFADYLRRNP